MPQAMRRTGEAAFGSTSTTWRTFWFFVVGVLNIDACVGVGVGSLKLA